MVDIRYRCEVHGITQRKLASLMGREPGTVYRWASTELEQPRWLADWMEYMDMELIAGRTPERIPRGLKAIHAFLYPGSVIKKRPRAPNGSRADMLAARARGRSLRKQRADNKKEMEQNIADRRRREGVEPIDIVNEIRKIPPLFGEK